MLGGAKIKKFKHKKKYGQNFLTDDNILKKIKMLAQVQENDLIIEIGAGSGNLTKKLQDFNANIICYEIDNETELFLKKIANKKTKIIYEDFLKVDIHKELKKFDYDNLYIIANLPYYITTPILKKIIDDKIDAKEIIIMVQKEVANRYTSNVNSKQYGSITVYLNYYFNIEKCFDVSRKSFYPVPKVDSSVIKLVKKNNNLKVLDEKVLFKLIKDSFQYKRKTLKNNLKGYDFHQISKVLFHNSLPDNVRAENISLEVFVEIANTLVVN